MSKSVSKELKEKYELFVKDYGIKDSFKGFQKGIFIQNLKNLPTDKELKAFFNEKDISSERNYLLISRKWSKSQGSLLFWGNLSADDEPRSFGGYTDDLRICERYSLMDIVEHNNLYSNVHIFTAENWFDEKFCDSTFYITDEQLEENFGKPALVVFK